MWLHDKRRTGCSGFLSFVRIASLSAQLCVPFFLAHGHPLPRLGPGATRWSAAVSIRCLQGWTPGRSAGLTSGCCSVSSACAALPAEARTLVSRPHWSSTAERAGSKAHQLPVVGCTALQAGAAEAACLCNSVPGALPRYCGLYAAGQNTSCRTAGLACWAVSLVAVLLFRVSI